MTQKTYFAMLMCMAILTASSVATAQDDALSDRGAQALAAFNEQVTTLQASFEQRVIDSDGVLKESASGTMFLRRPGQFAWHYESPYEQRIVADGTNLWLHDIDLEQVTVRAQDDALGVSPAQILDGSSQALDAFDYQGAFERDGMLWVQLQARDDSADFRAMRLGFREDLLGAMTLVDKLGQLTEITFQDVQSNQPIDAGVFEFVPPPNADVIGTPAGMPQGDAATVPVVPGLG
ncbi:MAG: outer membrane lipoprotein chaperone LolA [Pseudomonadota bacterium]